MTADQKHDPQNTEPRDDAPDDSAVIEEGSATVEELRTEIASLRDKLLRALAEQDNMRRRARRELDEAARLAAADLVQDLLPTADNLRRAIESVPQDKADEQGLRQLLDGVAATERGLLDTFERYGIRRIEPMGEAFDPRVHHAVFEAQDSDAAPGTVAEVIQPGYLYRDRLLRPAMVAVAKMSQPS